MVGGTGKLSRPWNGKLACYSVPLSQKQSHDMDDSFARVGDACNITDSWSRLWPHKSLLDKQICMSVSLNPHIDGQVLEMWISCRVMLFSYHTNRPLDCRHCGGLSRVRHCVIRCAELLPLSLPGSYESRIRLDYELVPYLCRLGYFENCKRLWPASFRVFLHH